MNIIISHEQLQYSMISDIIYLVGKVTVKDVIHDK